MSDSDIELTPDVSFGRFICSDCELRYIERCRFNDHLLVHHPLATVRYLCRQCCMEFGDSETLDHHVTQTHRWSCIYHCDHCQSCLWDRQALLYHMERHRDFWLRRTCRVCSQLFSTRRRCREHWYTTHIEPLKNRLRAKLLSLRLERDMKRRRVRKCNRCDKCGKIYGSQQLLDEHNCMKRSADGASQFVCEECGRGIGIKVSRRNSQEGLVTRIKENETNHKKIHESEELSKCSICLQEYTKKMFPDKFKRFHDNTDHYFMCEKCGKMFKNEEEFAEHRKVCDEPVAGPSHAKSP